MHLDGLRPYVVACFGIRCFWLLFQTPQPMFSSWISKPSRWAQIVEWHWNCSALSRKISGSYMANLGWAVACSARRCLSLSGLMGPRRLLCRHRCAMSQTSCRLSRAQRFWDQVPRIFSFGFPNAPIFLPYMPLASGELHAASTDVQDVLLLRKAASWRAVSGGDVLYDGPKNGARRQFKLPPGTVFGPAL